MVQAVDRLSSGIGGLDEVLRGGFVSGRMYLVSGQPGTGKTLLGMQFLEAGLENDERVLFIHGEESREEILTNGQALGIDIAGAEFLDLGPKSDFFVEDRSYDLVDPSEVDHETYTRDIHDAIERINPDRVVVDPVTQLRYIEPNEYQYRKRILSFMRFLKARDTTVVVTATISESDDGDTELLSLSDGVVKLSRGDRGRRVRVAKHRGFGQQEGSHGMEIREDGIEVYPALVPERHEQPFQAEQLSSGVEHLDDLLGGGIERGTVTFISGPTGAGKTTTATQFLAGAATEGLNAVAYLFEEGTDTFTHRSEAIGIPITELRERSTLSVEAIEPLALSAEEFAHRVRQTVDQQDTDVVLIDGIDGYTVSIQGEEEQLVRKLHSLTRHLKNQGVTVLVTDEISTITGLQTATSTNLSYIADNILFLSYLETGGSLRKVVGVLKKRAGGFEHSLREFEISQHGIRVGDKLEGVTGILQGSSSTGGPP